MAHWKGLDRHMTPAQKRKIVERAVKRLAAVQPRGSRYLTSLEREAGRLQKLEQQTRKGLHLTKQAYR